jgi:hypothetical protein
MRLATTAKSNSDNVTGSLSYINTLVTGATEEGKSSIFVNSQYLNNSMISGLKSTYGYRITERTDFMGTDNEFLIEWGEPSYIPPIATPTPTSTPTPTPTAPVGGSGTITFNGTNAYVRVPNATMASWLPDTADFTVEWFLKRTGNGSGFPRVFSIGPDTAATLGCSIEGGTAYIWCDNSVGAGQWMNGAMPAGYNNGTAWCHIAISRVSNVTRLYINGDYKSKSTDVRHITNAVHPGEPMYMGGDGVSNWFQGELTNFRWTNTGLYNSETTITVPSASLSNLAQTKLLLLGGSITNPVVDATSINTLVNSNTGWSADTPF